MAVEVKATGSSFERGTPRELFNTGHAAVLGGHTNVE
jgi:hypothetical protein